MLQKLVANKKASDANHKAYERLLLFNTNQTGNNKKNLYLYKTGN